MASKFVLSDTTSRNTVGATSRRLCVLDVKRAFLYGLIEEEIYIELPDEDIWKKQGFVGKLTKAMCGTRSANLMWQKVVREKMKALGFRACVTVPCLYYHQDRDVFVVVHVDDFLCSGETGDLAWFRGELENSFEMKSQVVGPGSPATYLGRRISWDEDGLSIDGEDKYIQKMLKEWRLERCTSLSTPGCDENKGQEGGNEALDDKSATKFRRSAGDAQLHGALSA